MIPWAALLGVVFGLGLTLVAMAVMPGRGFGMVLLDPEGEEESSIWVKLRNWFRLMGSLSEARERATSRLEKELHDKALLVQDAQMVGRSLESHALHKMFGLLFGAGAAAFLLLLADVAIGFGLPVPILGAGAAIGGLAGWVLPDSILRTAADKERELFRQVTESWLELVAQLVTAGTDTFAALAAAASYSDQPGFVVIRDALRRASVSGLPPWVGLQRLADERRLRFLDPFCSALELAGTTGAEARQAILAQVDAARAKALLEADAAAASSGEKMGAPLALIGGAFMVLMGYPPLAGVMGDASVSVGGL